MYVAPFLASNRLEDQVIGVILTARLLKEKDSTESKRIALLRDVVDKLGWNVLLRISMTSKFATAQTSSMEVIQHCLKYQRFVEMLSTGSNFETILQIWWIKKDIVNAPASTSLLKRILTTISVQDITIAIEKLLQYAANHQTSNPVEVIELIEDILCEKSVQEKAPEIQLQIVETMTLQSLIIQALHGAAPTEFRYRCFSAVAGIFSIDRVNSHWIIAQTETGIAADGQSKFICLLLYTLSDEYGLHSEELLSFSLAEKNEHVENCFQCLLVSIELAYSLLAIIMKNLENIAKLHYEEVLKLKRAIHTLTSTLLQFLQDSASVLSQQNHLHNVSSDFLLKVRTVFTRSVQVFSVVVLEDTAIRAELLSKLKSIFQCSFLTFAVSPDPQGANLLNSNLSRFLIRTGQIQEASLRHDYDLFISLADILHSIVENVDSTEADFEDVMDSILENMTAIVHGVNSMLEISISQELVPHWQVMKDCLISCLTVIQTMMSYKRSDVTCLLKAEGKEALQEVLHISDADLALFYRSLTNYQNRSQSLVEDEQLKCLVSAVLQSIVSLEGIEIQLQCTNIQ